MENKLFEEGMAKFLKSLVEVELPLSLDTTLEKIPSNLPTVQNQVDQKLAPEPAAETVATQYLDTKRLFYAKPPADSADWPGEINKYPQYKPLMDRISPYLSTVFGKSFVAKRSGAARYSPNQFRISLMGVITAPTILKYEKNEVKILEIIIPTLHSKQSKLKDPQKANAEPLKIKAVSSTEKDKGMVGNYDVENNGEEISKSELDAMIAQFSEGMIFEVKLSRPEKEVKKEAWSKLEDFFKEWFLQEIIAKNPKSYVDHHMSTPEGRNEIKQEFAKDAKNISGIDKDALNTWLGKEATVIAKKKIKFAEQMVQAIVGQYDALQRQKKLHDKEGAKWKTGEKENNAEEYVNQLIKEYPDFKPKTEKEAVLFVLSGKPPSSKEKQEERLKIFLRRILVETKKEHPVQKGTMGKEVSDLTLSLNNVVDGWIDNNSLISAKGGDIKNCDIIFMTASDLRFEVHKLMTAEGSEPQKEWDGKKPIQIVGNMIIKANILIDARLQPDNKTWEFRTFDTSNNPLIKKFGMLGIDKDLRKSKPTEIKKQEITPPPTGGAVSEI